MTLNLVNRDFRLVRGVLALKDLIKYSHILGMNVGNELGPQTIK